MEKLKLTSNQKRKFSLLSQDRLGTTVILEIRDVSLQVKTIDHALHFTFQEWDCGKVPWLWPAAWIDLKLLRRVLRCPWGAIRDFILLSDHSGHPASPSDKGTSIYLPQLKEIPEEIFPSEVRRIESYKTCHRQLTLECSGWNIISDYQ